MTVRFVGDLARRGGRICKPQSALQADPAGPSTSLMVSPEAKQVGSCDEPAARIDRDDLVTTLDSGFARRALLEDLDDEYPRTGVGTRAQAESDELALPSSALSSSRDVRS